ncbi:hypothetical protein CLU79DRAFT_782162 [Phycomyces nitens]|nr:hypothetical protein CLU79DRAFT_782162 [Phycomyces nitens]
MTISFEYFDPEIELGTLDENGRPTRPRKKPGRKPNPPSPAQRKAQNRAAQRAFRERKHREIKDAEATIKKIAQARDEALRETRRMKRKTRELLYEIKYLKGLILTFKILCLASNMDVPRIGCTEQTDEFGTEILSFSKTPDIPQALELYLDDHGHIISFPTEEFSLYQPTVPDSENVGFSPMSSPSSHTCSSELNLHTSSIGTPTLGFDINSLGGLNHPLPQIPYQNEHSFLQQLIESGILTIPIDTSISLDDSQTLYNELFGDIKLPEIPEGEEPPEIDARTGLPRITSEPTPDPPVFHEKKMLPPMTPIQALDYLRLQKNIDKGGRTLFTPTELQRMVPHDTRIDLIPGPEMRDHMIMFQDYYDANELFDYLVSSAMFLGGEMGNPDCWFVSPQFFGQYWFLCPNHTPERMDNAVEIMRMLGQRMMATMMERKEMLMSPHCKKESPTKASHWT